MDVNLKENGDKKKEKLCTPSGDSVVIFTDETYFIAVREAVREAHF